MIFFSKIKLQELQKHVIDAKGKLYSYECDVTKTESIKEAFTWIEMKFKHINILVNNAGTAAKSYIIGPDSNLDAVKNVINVNLIGVLDCTNIGYDLIAKSNDYGHIININSIDGHTISTGIDELIFLNAYPATKYGINAMSEVLRQELNVLNQKVKISQISPGYVKTDIFDACGVIDSENLWGEIKSLNPEDIANAALYILATPPHVQVHDIIIKPIGEKY